MAPTEELDRKIAVMSVLARHQADMSQPINPPISADARVVLLEAVRGDKLGEQALTRVLTEAGLDVPAEVA